MSNTLGNRIFIFKATERMSEEKGAKEKDNTNQGKTQRYLHSIRLRHLTRQGLNKHEGDARKAMTAKKEAFGIETAIISPIFLPSHPSPSNRTPIIIIESRR
jgi:hypothetical protein